MSQSLGLRGFGRGVNRDDVGDFSLSSEREERTIELLSDGADVWVRSTLLSSSVLLEVAAMAFLFSSALLPRFSRSCAQVAVFDCSDLHT